MKDFIYLNTKLVNSMLAQLDQGLILKNISDKTDITTNQEEGGSEKTTELNAGINLPLSAGTRHNETEIDKYSVIYSTSNTQLIETVIDDYALELLSKKIESKIKTNSSVKEGEFIQRTEKIRVFDFAKLKETIDKSFLEKLKPEIFSEYEDAKKQLKKVSKANAEKHKTRIKELEEELEKSVPNLFEQINAFSSYMDTLFDNSKIIKIGDTLSICENDYIRVTPSLLSIMNISEMEATILGTVIAKVNDEAGLESLPSMDAFDTVSNISNSFMDIMMRSFKIIRTDDYYVRPIAIYFKQ